MKPRLVHNRPDASALCRIPVFVERVMARWDAKQDTCQIGLELMTDEYVVVAALIVGREQRMASNAT